MKHLINIGFIIILVVVVLYVFKDELFYSPPKIENVQKEIKIQPSTLKQNEKQKIKKETEEKKARNNDEKLAEEKNILTDREKSTAEQDKQNMETKIISKGKVIEIKHEGNKIKGIVEINKEKLNFEMSYDPDMMLLLEDAKKLNLPLTFVIKKEGNKAYIEDIK
ncbi:hypothetical protein [Hydrogenivirga sp. 128-5-R1-1]|uniref:hypothetical protein n=1 Tax=Hydrogenivirga sp. 128-5-R1-1 TaxID=392423 RepID=UPI00015F0D4A|nr:hypothetical protein [Hydrogenivirga sp. 128-5-R1-1]EDP73512.1 hypothetical protein HG1285_04171 [Hydrogenivirga sp. 128-5-R1-1]